VEKRRRLDDGNRRRAAGRFHRQFRLAHGDASTNAQLTRGEITDLNVMTRRGRFCHSLQRIVQPVSHDLTDDVDIAIILSLHGRTTARTERASTILEHGDVAVIHRAVETRIRIEPGPKAICHLVLLREEKAT